MYVLPLSLLHENNTQMAAIVYTTAIDYAIRTEWTRVQLSLDQKSVMDTLGGANCIHVHTYEI